IGVVDVVGHGHVLLDFVELHRVDVGQGVFLTFNDTLLQAVVDLGVRHGGGVGTKCTVSGHQRGGLQDTHLDVFKVIGAVDGAYVVGHLTETGTPVVDAVQVVFRQGVQNFTANLARQPTVHGLSDVPPQ